MSSKTNKPSDTVTMASGVYKGLLFQVSGMAEKIKMLQAQCSAAEEYAHELEKQLKQAIAQIRGAE
jgi:hypothetical protein